MVGALLLAAAVAVPAATVVVPLPDGAKVEWSRGEDPVLLVLPERADGWLSLAERYTGDRTAVAALRAANPDLRYPLRDLRVEVPWRLLLPDRRRAALEALFPRDRRTAAGWEHVVQAPWGGEAESWWEIAELLCGDGRTYRDLRAANPGLGLFPSTGERVVIPSALLLPEYRTSGPSRTASAGLPRVTPTATPRPTASPAVGLPAAGRGPLEYQGEDAIYRLRPGEALYSAVVVRFTGQLHAVDVNQTAAEIAAHSGIRDVTSIPIGYPIRIPFDLLLPEYLPAGDPRRREWEEEQRELEAVTRVIRAANLEGIHVILDAGHGGGDTGAVVAGVWESTYAYDVMARVKAVLERETGATVWTTVQETSFRGSPPNRDTLPARRSQRLLVDPPYDLSDSSTGVHLRWVLSNAILHRLRKQGVKPEQVVFVSIHADSLHPSVRGLMVYVPGRRYRSSRGPRPPKDHRCREVSEVGRPRFSGAFLSRSEALSSQLARTVVQAARRSGVPIHPFEPVRSSIRGRGSRPWVPAVLKYNEVPSALLVEICNLNNTEDRRDLLTWRFRERLAHAIVAGLAEGFSR